MSLLIEESRTQTHTEGWPSEDSGRRRPATRRGERPREEWPSPWTSSFQNWGQINTFLLFHVPGACGAL